MQAAKSKEDGSNTDKQLYSISEGSKTMDKEPTTQHIQNLKQQLQTVTTELDEYNQKLSQDRKEFFEYVDNIKFDA